MKLPLTEAEVSKQISDYMKFRGWRRVRNQVMGATNLVTGRYIPAGEPGMPDLLFLRYIADEPFRVCAVWIEVKRKGAKLRPVQEKWHREEQLSGAIVKTFDCYEDFEQWYASALGWLHTPDGPRTQGNLDLFAEGRR